MTVVDTTAPTIAATTSPTTKTGTVTATFSETVQNVTTTTFTLERLVTSKKGVKYEPVAATVSPAGGIVAKGSAATLTPAQALPKGDYRVTITTGVTDMVDPADALAAAEQWTFTIGK